MEPQFDIIPFENGYNIKNGRGELCLEFKFIEDEDDGSTILYISNIRKCGDGKSLTRDMIKMIENKCQTSSIPPWSLVKYIKLGDNSSIHVCTVDIDLRYLKILTTGESWYNSFGYKSLNHDANVAHNAVIINKPMHELLSELYDKEYIKKFKTRFPELNTDLTVKEYVTAMSNGIPRSGTRTCAKDQEKRARLLFNLVHSIVRNEMLQYDVRLEKKVERGVSPRASLRASSPKDYSKGGGGTKRNLRKSRRKSRTRTRKSIKRNTM
jgi:hypothetical protein